MSAMEVLAFPVTIDLGGVRVQAHALVEILAYAVAFRVYLVRKRRFGDALASETRWLLVASAAVGAAVGSKLLAWLVDPSELARHAGDARWWMQQKTIVGAILGGWIAVEAVKRRARVAERTGDLFAVPLSVGIAIGRVGCFLAGLDDRTHGVASALPWAIDFGDGVRRHPVELYETVFAVLLGWRLARLEAREHASGAVFRAFVVAYMGWRVLVDFLKPVPTFLGLGAIQWAALATLVFVWTSARASGASRRAITEGASG